MIVLPVVHASFMYILVYQHTQLSFVNCSASWEYYQTSQSRVRNIHSTTWQNMNNMHTCKMYRPIYHGIHSFLSQKVMRVCNNIIATQAAVCYAKLLHGHVIQFPIIAEKFSMIYQTVSGRMSPWTDGEPTGLYKTAGHVE